MTIKIQGDEGPTFAIDGWRVVVEVDAANEVTVSVAGLDRAVAVGLLREAADVLESDGFVSECPVCSQPFVSYEYEAAPESFIGDGQLTVPLSPTTRTVWCANGHDHRVIEASRDEHGLRVRLKRPPGLPVSAEGPQHGPAGIPWRTWPNGLVYHDALRCPKCARLTRPAGCGNIGCGLAGFRGAALPGCPPYSDSDEPARYPLSRPRP